jgi:hypothetical protein
MSATVKITLSENAAGIVRNLETMPVWMSNRVAKSLDLQNEITVGHIQQAYLSFPRAEPAVAIGCRVQTNRLRGSVRASAAAIYGSRVTSAIGSNVIYAAAQEFGVDEDVTVAAHTRKRVSTQIIFGKLRVVRGADIGVRAHTRHMKLPARGFVQRGIADRAANYTAAISRAIIAAWNENATQ